MNHVLKHATTSAEQKAAYINPSLPIEARAVEFWQSHLARKFYT